MIEYTPKQEAGMDKAATAHITQINTADKILLGASQGIGNAILTTPLVKSLTDMMLNVDIITGEDGMMNGAEFVFEGMERVKVLKESEIKNRRYLLGVQTMWPYPGIEKYVAQIRFAPNINKVWVETQLPAHEVDINMSIARSLKFTGDTPELYCNYTEIPSGFDHHRDKKNIGVHVCRRYNHQFMANRRLSNPLAIARMLHKEGHRVFIIGHEDAVPQAHRLENPEFVYCLGQPLAEVAGLIRELDCMVNEDSGIMHITAAMKTPQIAVFGPTADVKNSPWSDVAKVVRKDMACAPCQYTERATNCCKNICMDIDASYIVKHVNDMIT
jgi:ADP-heptose:LPS heptosyltransferase